MTTITPTARAEICAAACSDTYIGASELLALAVGIIPSGRRQPPMEARQIDRMGRSNISLIGDWDRPTRQLIGVRGAPANTINHWVDYWIPRHSARVFVEEVDMVSGVGKDRDLGRAGCFHELGVIITNLAVFGYSDSGEVMATSIHPGVDPVQVEVVTEFALDTTDIPTTRLPTDDELRLIRETVDPHSLHNREVSPATERR